MSDFKAPKLNRAMIGIVKTALPLELWRAQIQIEVMDNGLARFKQFSDQHAVVVCNHSDQYDPEVMFAFSKMAGEHFHFITARDVFDWVFGLVGWVFQRLGCYSVARGTADIESFRLTRRLIAESKQKVVLFPEGEVTRQPYCLLPLRSGAIRLLLQAQQDLCKRHLDQSVLVIPMAIRWRYRYDITGWLSFLVGIIESKLDMRRPNNNLVDRVRAVASNVMSILEREYFCPTHRDLPYELRVTQLRAAILNQISQLVDVQPPHDDSHVAWRRHCVNAINSFLRQKRSSMSHFQRRVHDEQCRKLRRFLADLDKVQHLLGVMPSTKELPMTQERLAAMVAKLERLVLGLSMPKGPRIAMVAVGQPVPLLDFWPEYQRDENAAVDSAIAKITSRLQQLIDRLHSSNIRVLEGTPQAESKLKRGA